MDFITILFIGVGLAMDACAVSLAKGMGLDKDKVKKYALILALAFGFFQALMPAIGYFAGSHFTDYIQSIDHWIAFILLVFLGGRMIVEGFRGDSDEACEAPHRHGFWLLVTTAFATSLDAMAVGVGLAFLQVSIVTTALAIGCATFIMSTLGMMVGRFIGPLLGKRAEILGGIVLIGIGSEILWSHFAG